MEAKEKDSGLALLMVTILLFVLILVVTELLSTSNIQKIISENIVDDHMSYYTEEIVLLNVEEILFQDIEPPPMKPLDELDLTENEQLVLQKQKGSDSYHDHWASSPVSGKNGETHYQAIVIDEERKFNINTIVDPKSDKPIPKRKKFLEELLKNLGMKAVDVHDLVVDFTDFIDKNTTGKYDKDAKNEPLAQLRECLRMENVTEELFYGKNYPEGEIRVLDEEDDELTLYSDEEDDGEEKERNPFAKAELSPYEEWDEDEYIPGLKDVLTVYGKGKININTAPMPILITIFEEEDVAIEVIKARRKAPLSNLEDLKKVTGAGSGIAKYSDMIGFTSQYFKVDIQLKHRQMMQRRIAMMRRDSSKATILYRGALQ